MRRWPSSRSRPTSKVCGRPPRAVRACRAGGTVAWALDASLPVAVEEQVRALAEGAVIGGYDRRRWRSGERPRGVERFVICGAGEQLAPVADRAALVARWTNAARELVDAPPNVDLPDRPRGARRSASAAPHRDHRRPRGRARRAGRRRRQQPGRAAADRAPARAARRAGRTPARARREVGHVRHRRLLPQAAVGHRPPEGRHGRRRRGRRGAGRDRRARAPAVGHRRRCPPARTCSAAPRSGRRTSSRPRPA